MFNIFTINENDVNEIICDENKYSESIKYRIPIPYCEFMFISGVPPAASEYAGSTIYE
jgi:hypothetical protein